ncbi:hypothetical protein Tco_1548894 [Tanacetum coccineum]
MKSASQVLRRTVTYTRRSKEKRTRKGKGKAIMIESELKKKSKKEIEHESHKVSCSKDEAKDSCPGKEKYDQILEESGNYKIVTSSKEISSKKEKGLLRDKRMNKMLRRVRTTRIFGIKPREDVAEDVEKLSRTKYPMWIGRHTLFDRKFHVISNHQREMADSKN